MAIINSPAIGNGSKSLGDITYRQVRGRTIGSRKITENKSKTDPQVHQRNAMGELGRLSQVCSSIIEATFDRFPRGSRRNNFTHSNGGYMAYVRSLTTYTNEMPPIKNLCTAFLDERASFRLLMAKGPLSLTSSFEWNAQNELDGNLFLSRDFKAGDTVTVYVLYTYQMRGAWFDGIKTFSKVFSDTDIEALTVKNQFPVNKTTMPEVATLKDLPPGATNGDYLIAGVVSDAKKRTTSYLSRITGGDLLPGGDDDEDI